MEKVTVVSSKQAVTSSGICVRKSTSAVALRRSAKRNPVLCAVVDESSPRAHQNYPANQSHPFTQSVNHLNHPPTQRISQGRSPFSLFVAHVVYRSTSISKCFTRYKNEASQYTEKRGKESTNRDGTLQALCSAVYCLSPFLSVEWCLSSLPLRTPLI